MLRNSEIFQDAAADFRVLNSVYPPFEFGVPALSVYSVRFSARTRISSSPMSKFEMLSHELQRRRGKSNQPHFRV